MEGEPGKASDDMGGDPAGTGVALTLGQGGRVVEVTLDRLRSAPGIATCALEGNSVVLGRGVTPASTGLGNPRRRSAWLMCIAAKSL